MTTKSLAPWLAALLAMTPALARAQDKQACANAFNETNKLNDDGKLRDAIARAAGCVAVCTSPKQSAYQQDCAKIAEKAKESLATVVLDVTDVSGAPAASAKVTVDGKAFATAIDHAPLTIEPGIRVFTFELAGQKKEVKVELKAGEKNHPVSASFKVDAQPPPPPSASSAGGLPPAASAVAPPVAPAEDPGGAKTPGAAMPGVSDMGKPPVTTQRGGVPVWAWVVGGLGGASIIAGAISGAQWVKAHNDFDNCADYPCKVTAAGTEDVPRACTIAFGIAGGLGLLAGIYGVASAPPKGISKSWNVLPYAGAHWTGAVMRGTF